MASLGVGCVPVAGSDDGGSSGGSASDNGLTIDITVAPGYERIGGGTSTYYCPVVSPNPASAKVGQNFRWSNQTSDAGASTFTVLEGNTPLETVAPGQVGGWLQSSSAGTQIYSLSPPPVTLCGTTVFTLYVTAN
jgi:hypothetical protein